MPSMDWSRVVHDEEQHDLSVHELFERCYQAHQHLSDLPRDKERAQDLLKSILSMLQRCDMLIETTGVFSENEELDDISTGSLRYLLVQHLSAEVLSQTRETQMRQRLVSVALSCRHHQSFLKRLQQFDLLPKRVSALVDTLQNDEPMDPRTARTEKIEQKQLEQQVSQQIERLKALKGFDPEAAEETSVSGFDEETERSLWIAMLHHAAIKSVQAVHVLTQEQDMLAMMVQRETRDVTEDEQEAEEARRLEDEDAKAEMRAGLLKIAGNITSASTTSASQRERFAQDVFKPSHILPTYTVEQAGIMELREATERSEREALNEQKRILEQAAKSQDEIDEDAIHKQRTWDDWKDDHPTGYGNSKLRPCAL